MFKRSERVQELLRHEISTYLQQRTVPELGFFTITGVEISDDLTDAKVFFSVYGSDEEKEKSSSALTALIPDIRHHLGKKLESLYRAPNLQFVYDHTPERAQRVIDLLNQISKERVPDTDVAEETPKPAKARSGKSSKARKRPSKKA